MGRLIFTSQGLNSGIGRKRIGEALKNRQLAEKKVFLFHEPYFSIERLLVRACLELGFREENIFLAGSSVKPEDVESMDYIYVTEGNTFSVLRQLRERGYVEAIRKAFAHGATYIGASAGALIAGTDIALAVDFDQNESRMTDFEALGLFQGTVLAHFTKEELQHYKNVMDPDRLDWYSAIYQVEDGGRLELFTDFYEAYHFLLHHEIFEGDYTGSLDIAVVKVDPRTKCIENDTVRNTETRVWFETGPAGSHDYELDCGGATYEEATILLANLVQQKYGTGQTSAKSICRGVVW